MSLRATINSVFVALLLFNGHAHAARPPNSHIKAVAFDYFEIFDPNSVLPEVEKAFPASRETFFVFISQTSGSMNLLEKLRGLRPAEHLHKRLWEWGNTCRWHGVQSAAVFY